MTSARALLCRATCDGQRAGTSYSPPVGCAAKQDEGCKHVACGLFCATTGQVDSFSVFTLHSTLVHTIGMTRHDSNSDEALVEAIQQGDGDAAACLYHRYVDRVNRICYRIVLDASQVPDCVQEVWLKVFRSLGRFRCKRSFSAWLNAVTTHTAIDYYRRGKRHGSHADIDQTGEESLVSEERVDDPPVDNGIVRRRIEEALNEISVNQRTAFVLRYFEDMSLLEIARILGCREGTVRTHIRRSLLALRAKLTVPLNQ